MYIVKKKCICKSTGDYIYNIMDGDKLIRGMIGSLRMVKVIADEKGWELDYQNIED